MHDTFILWHVYELGCSSMRTKSTASQLIRYDSSRHAAIDHLHQMATRTRSSIVSSSLGDQLNCAVCLERFADPRTLPCHHSFCLRCLRGAPQEQEEGCVLIKCPTCREPSQLPEGGTDQLPTAFLINNLLELQDQAEHDQKV